MIKVAKQKNQIAKKKFLSVEILIKSFFHWATEVETEVVFEVVPSNFRAVFSLFVYKGIQF